jgi:hypothetical protein
VSPETVFYVNRNRYNRKRHLDPGCRYLRLAREMLAETWAMGIYDNYEEVEGVPPPTEETRFVEVIPSNQAELRALEAFTSPCILCVPGAKELWAKCPVSFE